MKRKNTLAAALVVPAGLTVLFELQKGNSGYMAVWVERVLTPLAQSMGRFWGIFPFSAAELFIALWLGGTALWLVRAAALLVRQRRAWECVRRLAWCAAAWLWLWAGLCWLWNAAYYAPSFTEKSGLQTRPVSVEELASTTEVYARRAAALSGQVPRDESGSFLRQPEKWFACGGTLYAGAEEEFPFLKGDTGRPKPLVCSRLQSRMGFTGLYFPFTGEANVNVDAPASLIPFTMAHEMSHQRMVASEQEANFVGLAACLTSGDPVFAYSGCLHGLISLSNALVSVDPQAWYAIAEQTFTPDLSRDWEDNRAYWAALESPLEEQASQAYDAFLKENDQQLGIRSYGACVDLILAWERERL